jgi:hypothetical protein
MQQPNVPGTDLGTEIAKSLGVVRSPEWSRVREAHIHLAKDQGFCAVCNGTAQLQVHHIVPFHFCHLVYRGDLELDERNLMTLCEVLENDHHNLVGHLEDWGIFNPGGRTVMADAFKGVVLTQLTKDEIKKSNQFQAWMSAKDIPKKWQLMSVQDKKDLRTFLDKTFPYIPTPGNPAPFPFMEGGDDGSDPAKIGTTYGSRLSLFHQQLAELQI